MTRHDLEKALDMSESTGPAVGSNYELVPSQPEVNDGSESD